MKGIRASAPGGLDLLRLVDLPDAAEPGPGAIRVRLSASSLNYHDYAVVTGMVPLADGRIPMSDGAGIVEAVGDRVTEFAAGDSVVSCFFTEWRDGPPEVGDFTATPGDGIDGYAREAVTVPAAWFTRAPAGWSHAEAAALTTAGLTAWRALMTDHPVQAGETVLVLGTGGVSLFAAQLAMARGARVIALSSSDAKLERLGVMGIADRINYRATEGWDRAVLEMTGGRGVDHVVEVAGPKTLARSIASCRVGGHISLIGVLTGFSGEVPVAAIVTRQQIVHGIAVGSRAQQIAMVDWFDRHPHVRPVIDRAVPLADIADAFRHEESGRHFGKIVLDI